MKSRPALQGLAGRFQRAASAAIVAAVAGAAIPAHAADTPSAWSLYAMQPGHNAWFDSSFPAVSWTFEVPGAAEAQKSLTDRTAIRDLVGFPIGASVVDGAVYAPNDDGHLYKFDAKSGKLLWSFNAYNQVMTTPIIADAGGKPLVFIGAGNSVFTFSHARQFAAMGASVIRGTGVSAIDAVNRTTGKLVWSYSTEGEDMPTPMITTGDLLIFGNGDGHVYALDAATGALKWKTAIASFVSMSSAAFDPVNGVVIMGGTRPSNIYALDVATGKRLWTVHPKEIFSSSGGDGTWAVAAGVAIGQIETRDATEKTTASTEELAIDVASGKILWSDRLGIGKVPPRNKDAVPTVVGGVVYTGSPVTHKDYAIDARTGAVLWNASLGTGMKAAPTVIGDAVIQPTSSGRIFTLDARTGRVLHVYDPHQGGYGPQNGVGVGGTFFIGTNSGVFQAIPLARLGVRP
ncbi:MAG: PQQ-binding-like beta-propeller repeat protein [Acetobacteraceae bacterium]